MTIEELYKLPRKKESLKKVDSFIDSSQIDELCHHQAICIKALILNEIGKTNEALTILLEKESLFPNMDKRFNLCYCDTLKEIFISIRQYDKALEYIQKKKLYLNLMDHDAYKRDMINFHLAQNNIGEAKRWLNSYINDDIADEDRIFAYETLIKFHYDEADLESFYKVYNKLRDYYMDMLDDINCNKIDIMKVHMLLHEKKTKEALLFARELIESQTLDNDNSVSLANIIIDIYIKDKDFKRASIIDSNFFESAKKASPLVKIKYFETTKDLYSSLNNRFSVDFAKNEIELAKLELERQTEEEEKVIQKKIKKVQPIEPIVIERVVEAKEEKNQEVTSINTNQLKVVSKEDIEVSYLYESLYEIFDFIMKINNEHSLRDILRETFIYIKDKVKFDEIIVLLNDDKLYGFHYKMERLYDKTFDKEKISNSIPYKSFESNLDIATRNATNDLDMVSPITLKVTEFKNQVAIPLIYDGNAIGSITYISKDEDLIKELNFEALKIITNIINTKIDHLYFGDQMLKEIDDIKCIFDNMPYGFKSIADGNVTLNNKAMDLLDISCNNLTLDEYLDMITPSSRIQYKNAIERLLSGKSNEEVIYYHLTDKQAIKENLYLKEIGEHYKILGVIYNRSDDEKVLNEYRKTAKIDPFTRLESLEHCKDKIEELYLDRKFSFVLLEANHFKLYKDVYGIKFARDLILAIGLKLRDIVDKYDSYAYHYDYDKFIILLSNNDERKAKRLTLNILDKLKDEIYSVNSRCDLTFKAAIYRVNKSSAKLELDNFIDALSDTLEAINYTGDDMNKVMYPNSEESKQRFYEFQMELHISEAIDNGKIKIHYRQIADMVSKNLFGYEAFLNLDSVLVDQKYFENIIKKRSLQELCDKYLITHTIMELHDFYKNVGGYFKVFLKVHASTLASKGFLHFLEEKFKYFKVPSSLFSFEIIEDGTKDLKNILSILNKMHILIGSSNIHTVLENNLPIFFCDVKIFDLQKLLTFKELSKAYDVEMILINVNSKDEFSKFNEHGFRIIKGNVLPKILKINEILKGIK